MHERNAEIIKAIIELPLSNAMEVINEATISINKTLECQLEERNIAAKEALQRYEEFKKFQNRNLTPVGLKEPNNSYK